MNRENEDGTFSPADNAIELVDGIAVARKTAFKVIWPTDVADAKTGHMEIFFPDGKKISLKFMGVALTEIKENAARSVFLGESKNSIGELTSKNTITYPFVLDSGIKAELRTVLYLHGFRSDLVLLEQLPDLKEIAPDFDLAKCQIEVWHEVVEGDDPLPPNVPLENQDTNAVPVVEQHFDFGGMRLAMGQAFSVGRGAQNEQLKTVVQKSWIKDQGKRYLVEGVWLQAVEPEIKKLPARAQAFKLDKAKHQTQMAGMKATSLRGRSKPLSLALLESVEKKKKEVADSKPVLRDVRAEMQLAKSSESAPGYCIDYTIIGNQSNFTFQGNTNYVVTNYCVFTGTTTFEGGAIIKMAPKSSTNPYPSMEIGGTVVCKTFPHLPVYITASDDQSIGEVVANSAAEPNPAYNYGERPLFFYNNTSPVRIENFVVKHALIGVALYYGTGHRLKHFQMIDCTYPIEVYRPSNSPLLQNFLIQGNSTSTAVVVYDTSLSIEHGTIRNYVNLSSLSSASLLLTNCLIAGVSSFGTYSGSGNATYTSDAGLFQTAGLGGSYLSAFNTNRNAGVSELDGDLLADLRERTTYPPTVLTSDFLSDAVLFPIVKRDRDSLDRGYHYGALDVIVSNLNVSNCTVLLTNGLTVGVTGTRGFMIKTGGKLISQGLPDHHNTIVRAHALQEGRAATPDSTTYLFENYENSATSEIRMRFTTLALMGDQSSRRYLLGAGNMKLATFALTDCQVMNAWLNTYANGTSPVMTFAWTNNLFSRCNFTLSQVYIGTPYALSLYWRNNLFRNCSLALTYSSTTYPWEIIDNFFEGTTLSVAGSANIADGWNGYLNTTALDGGTNAFPGSADYVIGARGSFYYGPILSGAMKDQGSRNADVSGLYHHVTDPTNTLETASKVDVGFHWLGHDYVPWNSGTMTVTQSSTYDGNSGASKAVDGNVDGNWTGNSISHTQGESQPWWKIDFGSVQQLKSIEIWNRTDCCTTRLSNFYVFVSDSDMTGTLDATKAQAGVKSYYYTGTPPRSSEIPVNTQGRFVRIQLSGTDYLQLAEVKFWKGSKDYDGDGVIDILEDTNGNGTMQSGETVWQSSSSGVSGASGLVVFTPLKP